MKITRNSMGRDQKRPPLQNAAGNKKWLYEIQKQETSTFQK